MTNSSVLPKERLRMIHKLIAWIKVEPNKSSTTGKYDLDLIDLDKLNLKPIGDWLVTNIYNQDKVSIVFPNSYIDESYIINSDNLNQKIDELKHFSDYLRSLSSKPSKAGMIRLKESDGFFYEPNSHKKPLPQLLFFVVKGRSELAVQAWFAHFRNFCQLRTGPGKNEFHWPPCPSNPVSGLKEVTEECFGIKFSDNLGAVWSFDFM